MTSRTAEDMNPAYERWSTSRSEDALNDLLASVRRYAFISSRRHGREHADEVGQQTAVIVLEKLPLFVPVDRSSFGRWVSRIVARIRAGTARSVVRRREDGIDEDAEITGSSSKTFHNLNDVPENLKEIAKLLIHGHTVYEVADRLGVERGSVLRKVRRTMSEKSASAP